MTVFRRISIAVLLAALACAQDRSPINGSPDRKAGEGEGPFDRMVIRGITMIDGTGAPARGRPPKGTKEIDGAGMFIMPGFVDLHVHTGGAPKAPDAEYVHKLWMAHGVTTVRGVPAAGLDWTLHERERSAKNQIVA